MSVLDRRQDLAVALTLHVVTGLVVAVCFVASRMNVAVHACPQDPACDQQMMNLGTAMFDWVPILIVTASVVITVLLWKRERQVFWIPLLALILVATVFVVSSLLVSSAW